ncbi:MAG TPA: phosphoglycerate kinase [Gammaproteobacteria bacterium]|nr:phosphoglycerate kinase [Gammaproteobacteria bacterium]
MQIPSMETLDLHGKKTMIRLDLNVPLKDGNVTSDARIQAALPTIQMALYKGAQVILLSHLGRPDPDNLDGSFSLEPVAKKLQEILDINVSFQPNWLDGIKEESQGIVLCENVRYEAGEKKNDESLSKKIAGLCDVYVMDAFGASHREHSSTYGALKYAKEGCIGPLLSKEVSSIRKAIDDPQTPVTAIIGGAKVSSKLGVIEKFSSFCDHVIVGGGIANTFLLASGKEVGTSLVEPEMVDAANRILQMENVNVPLPIDVRVAKEFSGDADAAIKSIDEIEEDDLILDIGPQTAELYCDIINLTQTTIWNGPLGVFEFKAFSEGTAALGNAVAANQGFSIVGGGDTVAVVEQMGVSDSIGYISTGGGAFLDFVQNGTLPILDLLGQ